MQGFFQKRDPWGQSLALWVLAGLAFLAPLIGWALKDLRLDNDMQSWLPAGDREAQVFQWFRNHFPDEQRIIASWEGSTLKDPRIQRFADNLLGQTGADGIRRGGSPYVQAVYTPHDAVRQMVECEVPPEEALQRLEGVLIGTGWMKVRLTEAGRVNPDRALRDLMAHAESRLGMALTTHPKVTDWIDETYLDELEAGHSVDPAVLTGSQLAPMIPDHDIQLSWEGMQAHAPQTAQLRELLVNYRSFATTDSPAGRQLVEDCFFAPGSPTAIGITLTEAGGVEPDDAIRSIRVAAEQAGIPEPALHIGGRAVTTAAMNAAVQKAAWDRSPEHVPIYRRSILVLSALVGLVLAFIFLRSIRLGILVVGISWYATGLSIGVIPLTGASMNMVLVVMPTLLMVLALSSAIHVANYWRHAACDHPETAVTQAVQMAKEPCVMAAVTTAIGLVSLCTSSLTPVRHFGLFSAVGCVVMLYVVLYGLPALLRAWPGRQPTRQEVGGEGWKRFGIVVYRHYRLVSALFIAACLAAGYGLRDFQTETKVVRYFPESSRLVQDYQFLEANLAGITPVDVVVRFDAEMQQRTKFLERLEIVRTVESKIREHREISGAVSLADFRPVYERPAAGRRMENLSYMRKSQAVERAVKGERAAQTAALLVVAQQPVQLAGRGQGELNGAGDELWRISAQASLMSDANYGQLTADLNELVQSVTRYHAGASHVVTGTVPLFLRTQEAVLESLIVSFAMAFGIISLIMMVVLRDVVAGLLSMIPNLLPVTFVFGLLAWNGQRVDIGTMITASVALGIAVDGTLHLLTWFKHSLQQGRSRFHAVVESLAHCAPAMWQTSAAVGIGLLMLYPAELSLISRFGWLMSALIGAALVADLVLLPALLSGWLGRLIERRFAAARSVPTTAPAPSAPLPVAHIPLVAGTAPDSVIKPSRSKRRRSA
jgi:predicted RND superfamily exporter protein